MTVAFAMAFALPGAAGAAALEPAPADSPAELPDVTDAPDPEADEAARRLRQAMEAYERGKQNYNLAEYETALADFKEASSLFASPDFQYNMGRCYEELGNFSEAIRAFSTYLKTKPDAEDRANVENRIRSLRERLKQQEEEAKRAAKPQVIVQTAPDDTAERRRRHGRRMVVAGAVLAGVGGTLALAGGVAFGVLASTKSHELEDVQTGGNPEGLSFDEAQVLADDGQRLENTQIAFIGAGAGVAVVGAVVLGVGLALRRTKPPAKATALVPTLGPGQAGISLVGRF